MIPGTTHPLRGRMLSRRTLSSVAFCLGAPVAGTATLPAHATERPTAPLTDGVIQELDLSGARITLRHAAIENLGLPPMTMVFRVRDPLVLKSLRSGESVRFAADRIEGKLTIVHVERR